MRRESSQKLVGNDQFEGYAIDLIYEISKLLGFNYTLKLVPDGRYGSYNEDTKEWDGMMGELLQQVNLRNTSDLKYIYQFTTIIYDIYSCLSFYLFE